MIKNKIRLLIIDDNPGDILLVKEYLRDAPQDYLVEEAGNLAEGQAKFREGEWHVVLLDLTLPDSQGIQTFEKIKSDNINAPLIILTGMNDQNLAIQAVRTGAQDYLVKDELSPGLLARSIKYAIERFGAEEKRRWLETKMLYSQKLESLSVLSGGIAQNFNSLLTAIIGNADLAMKKIDGDSSPFRNLERIKNSAIEAAALSNQMLAYSGMGRFVVRALNVSDLVEEMKPLLQAAIQGGTTVHYELATGLPMVKADIPQIKQLIFNIAQNAGEGCGSEKGEIHITTSSIDIGDVTPAMLNGENSVPPGRYLQLEISDNGEGIPTENLDKIMEPFFTTKFTGRGLGLAAAQGIVRGHGGYMGVTSEESVGTRIQVILPAVETMA